MSNAAFPTQFEALNLVLAEFVPRVRNILGDAFVGAYLQGSLALGDADAHSDVDFVIATKDQVVDELVPALQELHGSVFDMPTPWAQHLEGSYFPLARLRKAGPAKSKLLYIDNAHRYLEWSTHDDTQVVRWTLREHGVTLAGPDPKTLVDVVTPDDLRNEVRETMRWWADLIESNPNEMTTVWYQSFAVVSYCRMLHTLATGRVHSKPAGVEWALQTLDPKWHDLIGRAWAERPDPGRKVKTAADPAARSRTREFINAAIVCATATRQG